MSKLVSTSQRIATGVVNPVTLYSRVLTCGFGVAAGVGNRDWFFTGPVGNKVWLLNVTIWGHTKAADQMAGVFFYVATGFSIPTSGSEIATKWDLIISNYGTKPGMLLTAWEQQTWSFNMNRFYEGPERRFGFSIENFSATAAFWGNIAFQISEG